MPVVVSAACGFLAGLVAGLLFFQAPWLVAPAAAALAFACWRRGHQAALLLGALAAGVVWGAGARHERAGDCRLHWREGKRVHLVVERRDLPGDARTHKLWVRAPARCAGPVSAVLPANAPSAAVMRVSGTWRRDPLAAQRFLPPRPERAGRLMVVSATPLDAAPSLRARLRIGSGERLARLFGERRQALAAALTVSPEAALPAELRAVFRTSGLTHILSISGFHVAILAGALIVVLRAARLSPDAARIAGTGAVVGYVWLLGFPAPAVRSAGLIVLWCWARVRQRPPLAPALLAATALGVTVLDPWTVLEPGPWLSFAGVWGCAAASNWWSRLENEARSRRTRRLVKLLASVAVSVGATLATTPIQLLSFGTVTPAGIVANIAAIPLAAFAVPALALALAIAALPFSGAFDVAALPAAAAGLALDGLEHTAAWCAQLPGASFEVGAPAWAALAAAGLAVWLLRPGPRRRPASGILLTRAMMAGAALVTLAAWPSPAEVIRSADSDGALALHFLAVGQGDATAIRTPRGRWILVDGGPRMAGQDAGARIVVPFLKRHGVRRLDMVIASHPDADHLGGLPAVLAAVPVGVAVEPGAPDGRPLYIEWLGGLARGQGRWHAARAGDRYTIDGVTLAVWHPDSATIAERWEANENSVVITVEYGAFRAVFGGDAGLPMEALRSAAIGDVTLLKVGHHGSRSASGAEWLGALRPELCIIQVGAGNRYGHPHADVVARLNEARCRTWRTDRSGAVTVTTDGRTVRVTTSAEDTTLSVHREQP